MVQYNSYYTSKEVHLLSSDLMHTIKVSLSMPLQQSFEIFVTCHEAIMCSIVCYTTKYTTFMYITIDAVSTVAIEHVSVQTEF